GVTRPARSACHGKQRSGSLSSIASSRGFTSAGPCTNPTAGCPPAEKKKKDPRAQQKRGTPRGGRRKAQVSPPLFGNKQDSLVVLAIGPNLGRKRGANLWGKP